jgi:hypothetical protein
LLIDYDWDLSPAYRASGGSFTPFLDARGAVIVFAGEEYLLLCERVQADGAVVIAGDVYNGIRYVNDDFPFRVDHGGNDAPRAVVNGGGDNAPRVDMLQRDPNDGKPVTFR